MLHRLAANQGGFGLLLCRRRMSHEVLWVLKVGKHESEVADMLLWGARAQCSMLESMHHAHALALLLKLLKLQHALMAHVRTDGQMDRRTDGWTDRQTDRGTDLHEALDKHHGGEGSVQPAGIGGDVSHGLQYSQALVQHTLGVCHIVTDWRRQPAHVCLQGTLQGELPPNHIAHKCLSAAIYYQELGLRM